MLSDQEPHFFHKAFNLNWFQTPAGEKVPSDTEEQKPKGNDIFLIRHGQYFLSTGSLSDTGRIQAFYTGLRLREVLEGKRVKIFSSNMLRAQQTAAIIAKVMDYQEPIVEYEEMREAFPCTPELGYERKLVILHLFIHLLSNTGVVGSNLQNIAIFRVQGTGTSFAGL